MAHTRHVLVALTAVRACYARLLIAPAVAAATKLELAAAATVDLQAHQQPKLAFQSVENVERRLVHRLVEMEIGYPECHCVELADVKHEERDEHCCCCCCIGLECCFLADVVVVHCDYSSQKASEGERSITT